MQAVPRSAPPSSAAAATLTVSPQFRKAAMKVVVAIMLFALLYLVLLACSLALALGMIAGGIALMLAAPGIQTILICAALVGAGGLLLVFVVRFMLSSRKADESGRTEIFEEDYPALFAFIRQISEETGTRFPKHIYLSEEVNASVSYDSNFWSLFYPVDKNLVIGMGLVNMLDTSEFKAVIAHEFGHFSQKSMRAGSYVYYANKAIYSILFNDAGYGELIRKFANIHGAFAFCAAITVKVVQANQWVLRQAYKGVNKPYLQLSRQMEFHADAVSAHAAGSNVMIHALRRIEMADACFSQVIQFYNERIAQNCRAADFYRDQRLAAAVLAEGHELPLAGGLPQLADASHIYRKYNRVAVRDQWASHPEREEREAALEELAIAGEFSAEPAISLFPGADQLRQQLTEKMYGAVEFAGDTHQLDAAAFRTAFHADRDRYAFPAVYRACYDGRSISEINLEPAAAVIGEAEIEKILAGGKELTARISACRSDLELLAQVADKKNGIRSFDLDGHRHKRSGAPAAIARLESDLAALEAEQRRNDQLLYWYSFARAGQAQESGALREGYFAYFSLRGSWATLLEQCSNSIRLLQAFGQSEQLAEAQQLEAEIRTALAAMRSQAQRVTEDLLQFDLAAQAPVPEALQRLLSGAAYYCLDSDRQKSEAGMDEVASVIRETAEWAQQGTFSVQLRLLQQQAALAFA